ncbi:arginase family protein [Adhaeribacter pallidiroseus]|uniref:Arginase n=1 Tax=Adhaeribacter pallidiroseus TaxID=2072847 RepID=A0A369QG19_9BACT|nr:arginase family protein [Adhaeribacter pallidiroseus]RDC62176.1 Arginase [Adhaeribacter pallidiroseus]
MNEVVIVEFPSNLGLKEPTPGQEPGVRNLPDWLNQQQFHEKLKPKQVFRLAAPTYCALPDPETGVLNINALAQYAQDQASMLFPLLEQQFLVVIGGDCSILLGSALALKQKGTYALFYLDGHTDFMEPTLSRTGGVGGMAAAMVAGYGPAKLTQINQQGPYIPEEFVWCVGNREYDAEYEKVIQDSRATYVSLALLRQTGEIHMASAFLKKVSALKLDGFWLHLDVDVLDDALMPAVDSRSPGGLSYPQLHNLLTPLIASPKLAGLEITILDPDLDPTGQYTQAFVTNFVSTFINARKSVIY